MRNLLFALALAAIAAAHDGLAQAPGAPALGAIKVDNLKHFNLGQQGNYRALEGLSMEDRSKMNDLAGQMKRICPACSTGATVGGGPVITGGNVAPSSPAGYTVLFISEESVTIPKSEYESLKRKARLYDEREMRGAK